MLKQGLKAELWTARTSNNIDQALVRFRIILLYCKPEIHMNKKNMSKDQVLNVLLGQLST